jgi:hypothetical protein
MNDNDNDNDNDKDKDNDNDEIQICVQHPSREMTRDITKTYAAFMKALVWPPTKKILRVCFLDEPNENFPMSHRHDRHHRHGSHLEHKNEDPLQKKFAAAKPSDLPNIIEEIVVQRYNSFLGIKFSFWSDAAAKKIRWRPHEADIRISFDVARGCWADVGIDALKKKSPKATMNFGWFDVGTVLHEFGHALGLIHEHQNGLNDSNKIHWNLPKLYRWAKRTQGWNRAMTEKNIVELYDDNMINGSSYDPKSIMLYFFPASLTTNGRGTKQNLRLSTTDKKVLLEMYPTSSATRTKETFVSRRKKRGKFLRKICIAAMIAIAIIAMIAIVLVND